jgi:glycogen phosphorylase
MSGDVFETAVGSIQDKDGGEAMSKQTPISKLIYGLLPAGVEGFDALAELALDLRWSWSHAADEVWQQLDPDLWDLTHNPWAVLQSVSRDQLQRVSSDHVFRKSVEDLVQAGRQAARGLLCA